MGPGAARWAGCASGRGGDVRWHGGRVARQVAAAMCGGAVGRLRVRSRRRCERARWAGCASGRGGDVRWCGGQVARQVAAAMCGGGAGIGAHDASCGSRRCRTGPGAHDASRGSRRCRTGLGAHDASRGSRAAASDSAPMTPHVGRAAAVPESVPTTPHVGRAAASDAVPGDGVCPYLGHCCRDLTRDLPTAPFARRARLAASPPTVLLASFPAPAGAGLTPRCGPTRIGP